ncbi:TPA: LicD family protein [Streptococcus suis]|nr:LicD family protein [Streptococcus suis]
MRNTSEIEWELALDERYQKFYTKISQEQLIKLQQAYLEMYKEFDDFCNQHNLTSYMVAGTLIGALRHEGFIPWDDDIDLVMFRDDYEKFKKILKDHPNFKVIDPRDSDSIHNMVKIESTQFTYFDVLGEGFSKKKHIYLDMLPIDYVPKSVLFRKLKGIGLRFLGLSYSSARCYKKYTPHLDFMSNGSLELKRNLLIRKIIGFPAYIIGPKYIYRLLDNILKNQSKTNKVTIAFGVKGYLGETVDIDTFLPAKKYKFENQEFWGPNDANKYLTNRYGDYMKIPDVKEQLERHVRLRDDWENKIS